MKKGGARGDGGVASASRATHSGTQFTPASKDCTKLPLLWRAAAAFRHLPLLLTAGPRLGRRAPPRPHLAAAGAAHPPILSLRPAPRPPCSSFNGWRGAATETGSWVGRGWGGEWEGRAVSSCVPRRTDGACKLSPFVAGCCSSAALQGCQELFRDACRAPAPPRPPKPTTATSPTHTQWPLFFWTVRILSAPLGLFSLLPLCSSLSLPWMFSDAFYVEMTINLTLLSRFSFLFIYIYIFTCIYMYTCIHRCIHIYVYIQVTVTFSACVASWLLLLFL